MKRENATCTVCVGTKKSGKNSGQSCAGSEWQGFKYNYSTATANINTVRTRV